MNFTKMNGAGNDFVVVDNRRLDLALTAERIARLCDRHRGVGADGLLAVEPSSTGADFRMRYFNADGGEAEMCGNGARCFARFAARLLPQPVGSVSFDTAAGRIRAGFSGELVTLAMSEPHDHRPPQDLDVAGTPMRVHFLNTGVPHAVVFVGDIGAVDVVRLGAALRHHRAFAPQGANANFASVESPGRLVLRTYERGVEAETLACGTGVCAAALLHHLDAGSPSPVSVRVRGGDSLTVRFDHDLKNVTLTGPADFVFEGTVMD
jgi:diaminopimelate epimerase